MNYIVIDEIELAKVCTKFEDIALIYEFHLEKNFKSVEKIELMLDFLKEMGDRAAIAGSYFMGGVYLGEILKNSIGGQWVYVIDNKKIALKLKDEFIFPESVVRKYFEEDANGSLVFFVKTILAKFSSEKI